MQAQLQSFNSAVVSQAEAQGGTVGWGFFARQFIDAAKAMALAHVDTEAERDDIVAFAMALADKYVAPRFGPTWQIFRAPLQAGLDSAIDHIPTLLGGSNA